MLCVIQLIQTDHVMSYEDNKITENIDLKHHSYVDMLIFLMSMHVNIKTSKDHFSFFHSFHTYRLFKIQMLACDHFISCLTCEFIQFQISKHVI